MKALAAITPVLLIFSLACNGAGVEEPIHWGWGTGPNMASDARNLPADPGANQPLWELKLGTIQYSIPTIDQGRIYIACNDNGVQRPGLQSTGGGVLMCVEQSDGKLVWQMPSPRFMGGTKPPYHFDQWRCGICSGPVVDGDRVYVVTGRGEVLCLDREGQANGNAGPFMDELDYMGITNAADRVPGPTDGDIVWKFNMLTELNVVPHDVCGSTLLIVGDLVYACTSNGLDDKHNKVANPLAPTLIVLDKKTGRLVAKDNEKIGERLFHGNWSSPVAGRVNGRTLIFFGAGDGILYAFEPPRPSPEVQLLRKAWEYDCNPPANRMHDGKVIEYSKWYANSPEGPSEVIGCPVFLDGRIYVAIGQSPMHGPGRGCLSCVDAATGKKVWSSEKIDRSLATPAIAGGLLYIPDTIGNLRCFDIETGEQYWEHQLESKTWCSSAFVADGKVYAGTEANTLWVLKAGKGKQVLSRSRYKTKPITVTAADGVLYVPTQRSLIAVSGNK